MIAEDHFKQHVLEREGQYPYEDQSREPAETCFQEKAHEVRNVCCSEFYGRTTDFGRARRKVDALRDVGIPVVVCLSTHSVLLD